MEAKHPDLSCVDCGLCGCGATEGHYPEFCLTTHLDENAREAALSCSLEPENNRIAIAAAEVEYEGYGRCTRVEEIIRFARKIGAEKLGIAACVGLISEAQTLAKILRVNGFEVYGAACKVGAVPKTDIGIPEVCEKVGPTMCNPILQAELLNRAGTDLNLVVGLCVGHDSLFYKYSEALCTTVVTKDRVLAHNPAAALYTTGSYYKRLLQKQEDPEQHSSQSIK